MRVFTSTIRLSSAFPQRLYLGAMLPLLLLCLPQEDRSQSKEIAPVHVLTNHNDNARTGANLAETQLTIAEVAKPDRFGKLFSLTVDGQIYAQPLYLSDVVMADRRRHNVVFVATAHDSVYAFDADNRDGANDVPLWKASLLKQGPPSGVTATPILSADYDYDLFFGLVSQRYQDLTPEIGVIGTPVISPDHTTLYVVAATRERGEYVQRLHALDVATGHEKPNSPVEIQGSVSGIGDSSVNDVVWFRPRQHLQRSALLCSQGVVYVAFGSHGDLPGSTAFRREKRGCSRKSGFLSTMVVAKHPSVLSYEPTTPLLSERCLSVKRLHGSRQHRRTRQPQTTLPVQNL